MNTVKVKMGAVTMSVDMVNVHAQQLKRLKERARVIAGCAKREEQTPRMQEIQNNAEAIIKIVDSMLEEARP